MRPIAPPVRAIRPNATTTPKVRAAIQASDAPAPVLAERYGVTEQTVYKWRHRDSAPKLANWLEQNIPEGLAVFTLPEHHRKRLRTSNTIERSVQQELKRRTVKVRVFPSEDALLRLVSAVLVEIDEKWASETKAYIKWEYQDA